MHAQPQTRQTRMTEGSSLFKRLAHLAAIVLLCGLSLNSAAGAPVGAPLVGSDDIPKLLSQYVGADSFVELPTLAATDLETLARGEPVVRVSADPSAEHPTEVVASQTFGFEIVEAPRLLVWLALLGGAGEGTEGRFTRALLAELPDGAYVRYQHVALPWPIQDREWVIQCEKNVALARRSGGRIWEHHWSLQANGKALLDTAFDAGRLPGIQRKMLDESIYLPANRGAWILFDLGAGRTLVVAYLDVKFGGSIPDRLFKAFAQRQLRSGLDGIGKSSAAIDLKYKAQPLVHDGYGQPIPVQAAQAAGLQWRSRPLSVVAKNFARANGK